MKVRPLDDRILVKPLEAASTTAGGIVLPDTAKEKSQRGEVVSVGVGRLLDNGQRQPVGVNVGDTIVIRKYGGTDIKVDGENYQIMRESDILAVVEEA